MIARPNRTSRIERHDSAAHGKGDAMQAAMAGVGKLVGARLEIIRMTPVEAKGLSI